MFHDMRGRQFHSRAFDLVDLVPRCISVLTTASHSYPTCMKFVWFMDVPGRHVLMHWSDNMFYTIHLSVDIPLAQDPWMVSGVCHVS